MDRGSACLFLQVGACSVTAFHNLVAENGLPNSFHPRGELLRMRWADAIVLVVVKIKGSA